MNLEEIEKLPDIMPTEALALMFQKALVGFASKEIDKQGFLLILSQLTDRQVMTYELLENETRKQVDETLCGLWNTDSYEDVDIILSLVVNLGLENCFAEIKQSVTQNEIIDEMILNEILETIEEVGENISNPYHDLEKYK
ncbi:hypothetical protein [Paenibacillus soyae]|uniref:Uncharacterized protein n=1 Tax=Paenibacillus soyae TaxID=2969249 RepID=A0A9X2MPC5_9BACL|nr:hypothetical protein [Paenibacillus soyae]MCR2803386.1 hypothetical protein [Paenibacillus soyae]